MKLSAIFLIVGLISPHLHSQKLPTRNLVQRNHQKYLERIGNEHTKFVQGANPFNNDPIFLMLNLMVLFSRVAAEAEIIKYGSKQQQLAQTRPSSTALVSNATKINLTDELSQISSNIFAAANNETVLPIFDDHHSLSDLQDSLFEQWNVNVDTKMLINFKDFLAPNEKNPWDIKPFLDQIENDGILVSVGTERSFIDGALCKRCTSLVGVDINPRAKAYNDFNTLLLMLSRDRQDYLSLRMANEALIAIAENIKMGGKKSSVPWAIDYASTLKKIAKRIKQYPIDSRVSQYYLKNLASFAEVFYKTQTDILMRPLLSQEPIKNSSSSFQNANYLHDDKLFTKIARMAKDGKIISVIGNINEIDFLNLVPEPVVFIDISNIPDYFLPELNHPHLRHALVIYTKFAYPHARYFEYQNKGLRKSFLVPDH